MPLNINWQQILLHLFNFAVLFAILYFFLYNPVKNFMQKRSDYYKNLDDEANSKLQDAVRTQNEYDEKLKSADAEIEALKDKTRKELDDANALKIKQAKDEAEKIIADARAVAEKEREKMVKEAQNEISDMVTVAAEKLVLNKSTRDSFDDFLSAAKGSGADE